MRVRVCVCPCLSVCARVCACPRARVRSCVCAGVRAWVCLRVRASEDVCMCIRWRVVETAGFMRHTFQRPQSSVDPQAFSVVVYI